MASNLKPFVIGNSRNIKVTIRDRVTKAPIDVTGDKFYFTVKESLEYGDVDASIQVSAVAAGAQAASGVVIIPIPASETSPMKPETYFADVIWLRLTSAPGERETVFQDEVSFVRSVTNAQS